MKLRKCKACISTPLATSWRPTACWSRHEIAKKYQQQRKGRTADVKAVTTAGAHLEEWGKGKKMYDKAASLLNKQPGRHFDTESNSIKNHFQLVVMRLEKKDKAEAALRGISAEQTELEEILSVAASAMADSIFQAKTAKGEHNKIYDALHRVGEAVRRAAQSRQLARRAPEAAADDDSGEGEVEFEAGDKGTVEEKLSSSAPRRRRRGDEEDEMKKAIHDLIESGAEDKLAANSRRGTAEEKRLALEEKRLENESRAREEAAE